MTLKDRILSWFRKEELTKKEFEELNRSLDEEDIQDLVLFDKDEDDVVVYPGIYGYIDKDAVEGKITKPNLEEMIVWFTEEIPGKKAIWGGKETIAFKKWKAENNWD